LRFDVVTDEREFYKVWNYNIFSWIPY